MEYFWYNLWMEIVDARKLTRDAQEALRKRVIRNIEKGMSQAKACEIFGVSRTAIYKWQKRYKKQGERGLNKKRQGRPQESGKLTGWQASWVARTITDKCPEQLRFPWGLWTREAVQALIKWKYGIELSISSVSRLLKKWGFTPQKPIRRAYERNPKAISEWMTKTYPKIHVQAKKEKAVIHWGDEMGVRSTDQVGRSFSRKGKTPVITKTNKRFGCNMISTVTNAGMSRFMVFEESFTIAVFLKFLSKLIYKQDKKICLILDNHKVHHAKKTRAWIEKHKSQIELFFLPAYSPELNPDELLNQTIKQKIMRKPPPKNHKQLKTMVRSCVYSLQKSSQTIKNFFQKPELQYIQTISS